MDAAQVLQAVLSVVQSVTPIPNATPAVPLANTPPSSQPTLGPRDALSPPSLPQMVFMLLSMSAVRDWIKLLLLGAVLEGLRRLLTKSWENLTDYVWVTATFESNDDAAEWLMYWLSRKKVFQSARHIEVSTQFFGLEHLGVDDLGQNDDDDRAVAFMPSLQRTYSVWYKGRYMTVTRERSSESPYRVRPIEYLKIRMLSRNPRLLRELIVEARNVYKAASDHLISVHVAQSASEWTLMAMQEKRPTSSVILDPGVLELIVNDAKDFLASKKWYADRGIPFRRGYLLYGVPGAGKTSLIHSIAGELGLPIYILSLTVAGLDDNTLKTLIGARLPQTCIVLIEDIDAAFTRGMKRDIADPEAQAGGRESQSQLHPGSAEGERGGKDGKDTMFSGITLSGLLNGLDGIAAQEGRLLFATTNDYNALDPALLRPGRLDLHIEFHLASKYQATELFKRFYTASSDADVAEEDTVGDKGGAGTSPSVNSGPKPATSSSIPENVSSAYIDLATIAQASQLPPAEAAELAERFAEVIPPRTFSMATLQGYLMAYKTRPYVAVQDAPAWVAKKLEEKAAKAPGAQCVATTPNPPVS